MKALSRHQVSISVESGFILFGKLLLVRVTKTICPKVLEKFGNLQTNGFAFHKNPITFAP